MSADDELAACNAWAKAIQAAMDAMPDYAWIGAGGVYTQLSDAKAKVCDITGWLLKVRDAERR